MQIKKGKIIGIFESVGFPEFGIERVVAKIDTGAYSGALHVSKIIEKNINGRNELTFYPLGKTKYKFTTSHYQKTKIRSSNGQLEERFKVKTKIKIHDRTYPILITLSDRSAMRKEVLIGRNFLRKNRFLIDPSYRLTHK